MTQEEKTKKVQKAEEKLRLAQIELNKARKEQRDLVRKAQEHHRFMMGGIIVKYFPEAYDFSEQEMCRIIACAFKNQGVKNMIATVKNERAATNDDSEERGDDFNEYEEDDNEANNDE